MTRVPLVCPLPSRDWYQLDNGKWASRAWNVKSKMIAERGRYALVSKQEAERRGFTK